jgi:hypothetical protein
LGVRALDRARGRRFAEEDPGVWGFGLVALTGVPFVFCSGLLDASSASSSKASEPRFRPTRRIFIRPLSMIERYDE